MFDPLAYRLKAVTARLVLRQRERRVRDRKPYD
jgi:hypothetical protein